MNYLKQFLLPIAYQVVNIQITYYVGKIRR